MPHQCTGCGHTFPDGSKEMLSGCPDCGGNKFQFRPAGSAADSDGGTSADSPSNTAAETPSQTGSTGTDSDPSKPADAEPPGPADTDVDSSSVAETVGRATTQLRDLVSTGPEPPTSEPPDADAPDDPSPDAEWPDDWANKSSEPDGTSPDRPNDDIIDADARRESKQDRDHAEGYTEADTGTDTDEPGEGAVSDSGAREPSDRDDTEDFAQASARSDVVPPEELEEKASPPKDPSAPANAPTTSSDAEVVSEPTGEEPDLADLREQLNDQFESIKILEPGQYELNLMELYDREEYIIALQENGRYVIQVPEQWIGEDIDDR